MNVYDSANATAKAIKESQEHKRLLEAKNILATDAEAEKMVKDFLRKQTELQFEVMSGKQPDEAKHEQLQKLYELISLNTKGRDYLQAYMRFQLMMEDVSKIISDAVSAVVGSVGNGEK